MVNVLKPLILYTYRGINMDVEVERGNMTRRNGSFRPEIDYEIGDRISKRMADERYMGSRASYIESIILKFLDGLLTEHPTKTEAKNEN